LISREDKKREKKERILNAAAKIFNQKGYNGTVIADIAAEARIGKGTLYEYFDSKEDLFFGVFEWFTELMTQRARVSLTSLVGSAADRLIAVGKTLLMDWPEMKAFFSLVMEFWAASASGSPQLRQRFKDYFNWVYGDFRGLVSGLIREGIERGEFSTDVNPEAVAAVLVGTWDALLLQAWFDDDFDPADTLKDFIPVLLQGLRKGAESHMSQEK
jgi:AcrR family transcriptional regulator